MNGAKQEATNTFDKGLVMDRNPILSENNMLTDCLNGTIITYDGNEFNLQNDMGNYTLVDSEGNQKMALSKGFIPVGMKSYGGVVYIASYRPDTEECEIGSFPAPGVYSYEGTSDPQIYCNGSLAYAYKPLNNLIVNGEHKPLRTTALNFDLSHPVDIEVQPSYDGSVNLILNDDKNPPRCINSGFSVRENGTYDLVHRNQYEETNSYESDKFSSVTRLVRTVSKLPRLELENVISGGQLKGGNYTFYIKFADGDYNKTDIVCESSIVSIFKGDVDAINSISGTLQDERTDKAIQLKLNNIDTSFSNFYVYYVREYSDIDGNRLTESMSITKQYQIPKDLRNQDSLVLLIDGFETVTPISIDELNIQYLPIDASKTMTQEQDMLFLANIKNDDASYQKLQDISYKVQIGLRQKEDSIGWVEDNYEDKTGSEYYNPKNIYNYLGYWPEEYYRFGIVYIKDDDTLTPVFNLIGCELSGLSDSNITTDSVVSQLKASETGIVGRSNRWGVFKNPTQNYSRNSVQGYHDSKTRPWYYKMIVPETQREMLSGLGIKGYFIVRQKRIPTILCQGLSIAIDSTSHTPMLYDPQYQVVQKDATAPLEIESRCINGD